MLYGTAPRIVAHPGAFNDLPRVCDDLGIRRAIVVASCSVETLAAQARNLLAARMVGRFSHPLPHVRANEANLAVASAQEVHADGVIAIGGGSAIGYGKIIALALRIPLISAPTTYAGAEMTDRYSVTTERGKEAGYNERVLPRVVLRDPLITLETPMQATVSSAMTAIGHCLESLWHPRRDIHVDTCAHTALRTLWSTLPKLLRQPRDPVLREAALQAAGLAGAAQHRRRAGLLTVLAEKLGGRYQVDHGALVTCLAPRLLDLYGPHAAVAHHALAEVCGNDITGHEALMDMAHRLRLPTRLADLGVNDDLRPVAAAAIENASYACTFGLHDVSTLLVSV